MSSHIIRMQVKLDSRKNRRKNITYLGMSSFLVGSACTFFASWVSTPADVPVPIA
jgi:hypothetical protein